jgi:predicted nucleotidyltransferase
MRLPNFKRLFENDFTDEEKPLVSKLAGSLNQGIENLYLALSKRLTLRDNIQCTIKDIDVIVDSNGKPTTLTTFRLDDSLINQNVSILGCQVLNAVNLTNTSNYVYSCPFISWTQISNGIQINHITGLIPGNKYNLRIVAFN